MSRHRADLVNTFLPDCTTYLSTMIDFLQYLAKGEMTDGERELAINLTVIYGLSLLSMVVLYKLINPSSPSKVPSSNSVSSETSLPSLESTLRLIKTRRTITPKDFSGEVLPQQQIETLLEAANWAPTHKKNEPWRFTVISGPEKISDYLDLLENWYSDHKEELPEKESDFFAMKVEGARNTWPTNASHVIVLGMVRHGKSPLPEWEEICALATSVQNIHLALTSIPNSGGFWSSHTWCRKARDSQEMRDFLGLRDTEDRVFGAFILGKVEGDMNRFKSNRGELKDKVQWLLEEDDVEE